MEESSELAARRVLAAQNQSLFRDLNEQVVGLKSSRGDEKSRASFVCECLDLNCAERILLSRDEYEQLRQSPTRFLVLPGHEVLDVEVVVDKSDAYFVVRTIGAAAEMAAQLDRRPEVEA